MSTTAINDLARQAFLHLQALSTPTSPHYSCSLSKLPPTQRIPLAFTLADRSFPFALTPKDLSTAYTLYTSQTLTLFCLHCHKSLRDSIVSYGDPEGGPGYICTPCMDKYALSIAEEKALDPHGRGTPTASMGGGHQDVFLSNPTLVLELKPLKE